MVAATLTSAVALAFSMASRRGATSRASKAELEATEPFIGAIRAPRPSAAQALARGEPPPHASENQCCKVRDILWAGCLTEPGDPAALLMGQGERLDDSLAAEEQSRVAAKLGVVGEVAHQVAVRVASAGLRDFCEEAN